MVVLAPKLDRVPAFANAIASREALSSILLGEKVASFKNLLL